MNVPDKNSIRLPIRMSNVARLLRNVFFLTVFFGCVNYLVWHYGDAFPVPGPEPKDPSVIPDSITNAAFLIQFPFSFLAHWLLPSFVGDFFASNDNIALLFASILPGVGYALIWELLAFFWRQLRGRSRVIEHSIANET